MKTNSEELLEFAIQLAKVGGTHTLKYFRKNIEVIKKKDDSPVTIADREAEWVIREEIIKRFPDHGIIGEEHGIRNKDARIQWILDPIDGTVSFIHGIPLYTTLIAVTVDAKPAIGIIYAPAMDELVDAALGFGTRLNGVTTRVRKCASLDEATFLTTDQSNISKHGFSDPVLDILSKVNLHRTWGDAYGHMMVATGRADIMFDPILNLWDAAALLPVLQEAGGSFINTQGNPDIYTGNGLSCAKNLEQELIRIFKTYKI